MTANHPPRELVRVYLAQRREERIAPPSLEEIRTMLGWKLVRTPDEVRKETSA